MKEKPKVQGGLSPATSTPGTYSLDQNGPSKTDTASPELVVARNQGAKIDVIQGLVIPWADSNGLRPCVEFTSHINRERKKHKKGSPLELLAKEAGNSLFGKGEKDRADKDALVQDAQLMSELRVQLEALVSKPDMLSLNRENSVRLLNIILKWLGPAMKINIGMVEENITIFIDHDSINLLIKFVDALKDLDNGKTHEAFKPNPCGATASLTNAERKRDDALVEMVRIIEWAEGLNSRSEAEAFFEKKLAKAGALRRNKQITAKILKSLSDRYKRRKVPHK